MKIVTLECKSKVQVAEEVREKGTYPDDERKTDSTHDLRLLQNQGYSRRSHKHEHHSWQETLIALEKAPEADLVEGLYLRQVEESTLMPYALTLFLSYQVHRRVPKSNSSLQAMVSDVWEDQHHSIISREKKV